MFLSELVSFIKENRLNGKRPCFQLIDTTLQEYLKWAFFRDCLLVVSDENGISGVAVAYALPKHFDGDIATLVPYDDEMSKDDENRNELCVMDWIAVNSKSRKALINQFAMRFPNWQNQHKWGLHYGTPKLLTNKYMNLLKGIN